MIELPRPSSTADISPGLQAYVAMPTTPGPWPGVVVVHEIFGLDEVMMRQCDHLASLGYLAVMPDLFVAGGGVEVPARHLQGADRRARSRLRRPRGGQVLPRCPGRLHRQDRGCRLLHGVEPSRCCWPRGGYDASSVNYGRLPKDLTELVGACPIVASYGGSDVSLRGAAAKAGGRAEEARGTP